MPHTAPPAPQRLTWLRWGCTTAMGLSLWCAGAAMAFDLQGHRGARGLAPTSAATGQMIVYSAGIGQQALDSLGPKDTEPNSVFTRVFVREMHKPGLSLDKIVRNVRSEVVSLARSINHEQVPAIYDQVIGEFFFIKP